MSRSPFQRLPSGNSQAKLGSSSNRVKLKFGSSSITLWGSKHEETVNFLLCVMRHWTSCKDHPLGNLVKVLGKEGELGAGILNVGRHMSRVQHPPGAPPAAPKDERPSSAPQSSISVGARGQKGGPKANLRMGAATDPTNQATNQSKLKTNPNTDVRKSSTEFTVAKNASSVLALESSSLIMVLCVWFVRACILLVCMEPVSSRLVYMH